MANFLYDEVAALLSSTKVIDGRKTKWWNNYPFVIVEEETAFTPASTANESQFAREYAGVLTLVGETYAMLETLIETVYGAMSADGKVWNPSKTYDHDIRTGFACCKLDIRKEEIILPAAW